MRSREDASRRLAPSGCLRAKRQARSALLPRLRDPYIDTAIFRPRRYVSATERKPERMPHFSCMTGGEQNRLRPADCPRPDSQRRQRKMRSGARTRRSSSEGLGSINRSMSRGKSASTLTQARTRGISATICNHPADRSRGKLIRLSAADLILRRQPYPGGWSQRCGWQHRTIAQRAASPSNGPCGSPEKPRLDTYLTDSNVRSRRNPQSISRQ
jgi:hypothetical protein